jgi:hypothetical protein
LFRYPLFHILILKPSSINSLVSTPRIFFIHKIQDACKVFTLRMMKKYNTLGINETGKLIMPESTLKFIEDEKIRKAEAEKTKGKGHH